MAEELANVIVFEGDFASFQKKIMDHEGLTVVEFASTTCMPCRRVRQLIPGFAKDNPSVLFLVVEVDQHPELGDPYGIKAVPHMKYFKGSADGKPVEVGAVMGANIPDIKGKIAQFAA
jgi:thioredoxin 1